MTPSEIRAELRRSACEDERSDADMEQDAFDWFDALAKAERTLRWREERETDELRRALVAEAMET